VGQAVTGVPSKAVAVDEEGQEPELEMKPRATVMIVMGLQERGPPSCSCKPLPHIHVSRMQEANR
jgi:hypothetical protein